MSSPIIAKIKIYAGLSVSNETIETYLPSAHIAGPIRRGDLPKDIDNGFQVIGIIDGEFLQTLAVSPNEIVDGLRMGLKIYGSSSMGAMRAAELRYHGLIGCGSIYEYISQTNYFPDDYLGQTFTEDGLEENSFPMIELILTVDALVRNGKISSILAKSLISKYGEMHFSERNLGALERQFNQNTNATKIIRKIKLNKTRFKNLDAVMLLKKIQTDLRLSSELNRRLEEKLVKPIWSLHEV